MKKYTINKKLKTGAICLIVMSALADHNARAGQYDFPPSKSKVILQTNGPVGEIDNGDYWSNSSQGGANMAHSYAIFVPAAVDANFTINLQIFDPESFKTGSEIDEKKGTNWDVTTFKLIAPDGVTTIKEESFNPVAATSNIWYSFAAFTAGQYGYGIYYLEARTGANDENMYRLRIVESDPDQIAASGDEINIAAVRTSLQMQSVARLSLSFFVPQTSQMIIGNFDYDLDSTLVYVTPGGAVLQATKSNNSNWNNGGGIALPPPGGDLIVAPESGWWTANCDMHTGNQFTFYCQAPYFIDTTLAAPKMNISLDDGVSSFLPGSTLTYVLRLGNQGEGAATYITVRDTLPEGVEFIAADNGGTVAMAGSRYVVEWLVEATRPGESKELNLTVRTPASVPVGSIDNRAFMTYKDVVFSSYPGKWAQDVDALATPGGFDGTVWRDTNYDGAMDEGEPGIGQVQVLLISGAGDTLATTLTNATGQYAFTNVAASAYRIVVNETSLPDQYSMTNPHIDQIYHVTELGENYTLNLGYELGLTPVELSRFEAGVQQGLVKLQWTTQSETENLGFHVLRSTQRDKKYIQINDKIIPGAGTSQSACSYFFDDTRVEPSAAFYYKLVDVDYSGRQTEHEPIMVVTLEIPEEYALAQNFPNPFNSETVIEFSLKDAGHAEMMIYNLLGQAVRVLISENLASGKHTMKWDGRNDQGDYVQSGIYFYVLQSNNFKQVRKMQYIK